MRSNVCRDSPGQPATQLWIETLLASGNSRSIRKLLDARGLAAYFDRPSPNITVARQRLGTFAQIISYLGALEMLRLIMPALQSGSRECFRSLPARAANDPALYNRPPADSGAFSQTHFSSYQVLATDSGEYSLQKLMPPVYGYLQGIYLSAQSERDNIARHTLNSLAAKKGLAPLFHKGESATDAISGRLNELQFKELLRHYPSPDFQEYLHKLRGLAISPLSGLSYFFKSNAIASNDAFLFPIMTRLRRTDPSLSASDMVRVLMAGTLHHSMLSQYVLPDAQYQQANFGWGGRPGSYPGAGKSTCPAKEWFIPQWRGDNGKLCPLDDSELNTAIPMLRDRLEAWSGRRLPLPGISAAVVQTTAELLLFLDQCDHDPRPLAEMARRMSPADLARWCGSHDTSRRIDYAVWDQLLAGGDVHKLHTELSH
jgi:hypothetical protein